MPRTGFYFQPETRGRTVRVPEMTGMIFWRFGFVAVRSCYHRRIVGKMVTDEPDHVDCAPSLGCNMMPFLRAIHLDSGGKAMLGWGRA